MAHALSASSLRSDRMSPPALALAVLLHALVILALWWLSLSPPTPPVEEAIEVTFEQPKPEPTPPPPPEPARQLPPPAPPIEGLRPPAPLTSDNPTQVPPSGERPDEPPAPPPPPLREALPSPQLQPTPPTPVEPAKPTPSVPQQAPGAQQKQALAAPPPAKPPPPQPQRPVLPPSPLTTAPPQRPPAGRPTENASRSPFVNPADTYSRARVADNYLWQVMRRLVGYRYEAHVEARQGITVVRIVIARDGRLLDVEIAQSSGYPEFDRGVLAGVRAGSPYDPLPPDIRGNSATFTLPLVSVRR